MTPVLFIPLYPRKKHQESDDQVHLHLALRNACLHEAQYKTLSEGEALIFKLTGYASKRAKNKVFFSDPFYVTPGGYKMCIRVYANGAGDGKGTHVSVYNTPLEGCYDDQIHWPFLGTVTYDLLNQLADDKHHSRIAIHNAGCFVPSSNSLLSAVKQTNIQTKHDN